MSKNSEKIIVDVDKAMEVLRATWTEIKSIPYEKLGEISFVDYDTAQKIKQILNSRVRSFKYALVTQTLAKTVEPSVNCLVVQAGASIEGSFDARSFCKKTVVVFEREQLNNVFGGSSEPYVSKPLRHEKISLGILPHIKDKQGWKNLFGILSEVQDKNSSDFALSVLKQIFVEVRFILAGEPVSPPQLSRVPSGSIKDILSLYLAKPSQGLRSQAVVYALFKTFNDMTRTFSKITTMKPTVADRVMERVADIECVDENGELKLAICVTDNLTFEKLSNELEKSRMSRVKNLLVLAHKITVSDRGKDSILRKYLSDINVSVSSIVDFILTMTVMLNGEMRRNLILTMYDVLKEIGTPEHLKEWDEIVKEVLKPWIT